MNETKSAFIAAELDYIKDTISQGIQDRYQLMSFYLTIAGILAGASTTLLSLELPRQQILIGIQMATFTLGFLGIIFWLKVKRLRQAWHESLLAFNQLKQNLFSAEESKKLFKWSKDTVPSVAKSATVNYYAALIIFLIAFLSFGFAAAIAVELGQLGLQLGVFEVGFALSAWNIHLVLYKVLYT